MAVLLLVAIIIHFLHQQHQLISRVSYHGSSPLLHGNNSSLRIATLNLRVPFSIDIQHNLSWIERRSSIISSIHNYQPHILALQEDCYFMNQDIMNLGRWGDQPITKHPKCPIWATFSVYPTLHRLNRIL